MATGTACSPDTPFMPFLVGLLINTPRLVDVWKENLALMMEKWLVKIWQTGQLVWSVWWPGSAATPMCVCV